MGEPKLEGLDSSTDAIVALKKSILFQGVEDGLLVEIAKKCQHIHLHSGDPVFVENELSSHVYFVISGSVEIISYKTKLRQATRVKKIESGEHFSEFSVLTKSNHSTSCFALEDTELLSLSEQSFSEILNKHANIAHYVVKVLGSLNEQFLRNNDYIEYFDEKNIQLSNEIIKYVPQNYINKYQVLPLGYLHGVLSVALKNPYNKEFVREIEAKNPDLLLKISVINDEDYALHSRSIVEFYNGAKREMIVPPPAPINSLESLGEDELRSCLLSSKIFADLKPEFLDRISPYFQLKQLAAGESLSDIGSSMDKFFIVHEGQLELLRKLYGTAYVKVGSLGSGKTYGELLLLSGEPEYLDVKAASVTNLFYIDKKVFDALFQYSGFSIALAKDFARRLQQQNKQTRIRHFSEEVDVEPESCLKLMSLETIKKEKILPLVIKGDHLTLGVIGADRDEVYDIINKSLSKYRISLVEIQNSLFNKSIDLLEKYVRQDISYNEEIKSQKVSSQNPISFVEELILNGFSKRASDIHLEPQEDSLIIRFRVDGEMRAIYENLDYEFGLQLVNRIKVISEMDISERRFPQDGQAFVERGNQQYQARVSTVPTKLGEKVVLRLVHSRTSIVPLNRLVPDKALIKFLHDIVKSRQGLFLVTGPTGSGKTTTLYSLLNEIIDVKTNVVSVEDPVELIVPGVTQIQVNDEIDLSYGKILRHVLRQDPDTIMVGEIRDEESAQIVFQAALTGHLVFTTLHSTNTLDTISRLGELGISEATIASGLLGVMAQRLIPAICKHCKVKRPITAKEVEILKETIKLEEIPKEMAEGKGCEHCDHTGYYDRVPVFEFWKTTGTVKNVIVNKGSHHELLGAVELQNFRSLNKFALLMALNGLTTIEQVEHYLYGMEFEEFSGF